MNDTTTSSMRKKLLRFETNKQLKNVIEPGKALYETIKGHWHSHYFQHNHPITLEIGCGDGAYTIGLAMRYPSRNFIGIEVKGDRLCKGALVAQPYDHIAFLRTSATQLLNFFNPNEVSEIWIPFPDPQLSNRNSKHRLTHPRFLQLYSTILLNGGKIHLKTDSALFFHYTLKIIKTENFMPIAMTNDLYNSTLLDQHFGIQTSYEKRFLAAGKAIHYLCFVVNK